MTTTTTNESIDEERANTLRAVAIAELRALVAVARRICPDYRSSTSLHLPISDAGYAVLVAAGAEISEQAYGLDPDSPSTHTIHAASIVVDGVRMTAQRHIVPVRR